MYYLPIGEIKPNFMLLPNDEIKMSKKHSWTINVRNFLLSRAIIDKYYGVSFYMLLFIEFLYDFVFFFAFQITRMCLFTGKSDADNIDDSNFF